MDPRRSPRPQVLTTSPAEFCDTNILAYAYGQSTDPRHARALELVQRLWESSSGAVSIQVLQELYVTLTRKVAPPLATSDARTIITRLCDWHVVEPTKQDVLDAVDRSTRWQISFWDAMLLTTAAKAGATTLWSEDLSHEQTYDGVTVRNPFAPDPK